jgi:hypothetical protein
VARDGDDPAAASFGNALSPSGASRRSIRSCAARPGIAILWWQFGLEGSMKYLAILALIAAAFAGSWFLTKMNDWNREQSCASAGGRNCGLYGR